MIVRDLLTVDVIQEFALDVFVFKLTGEVSGSCLAVGVANAARSDAHVIRIDDYTNVGGMENTFHLFAYLYR